MQRQKPEALDSAGPQSPCRITITAPTNDGRLERSREQLPPRNAEWRWPPFVIGQNCINRQKQLEKATLLQQYVDDHQLELTQRFHEMGLVCACPEVERLAEALQWVQDYRPAPFRSNTEAFLASLDAFLNAL